MRGKRQYRPIDRRRREALERAEKKCDIRAALFQIGVGGDNEQNDT